MEERQARGVDNGQIAIAWPLRTRSAGIALGTGRTDSEAVTHKLADRP
ncbi:hypothetical protein [Streptomyces cinereoruber]